MQKRILHISLIGKEEPFERVSVSRVGFFTYTLFVIELHAPTEMNQMRM